MHKKLSIGEYGNRILLMIIMVLLIEFIQVPIALVNSYHQPVAQLLLVVGYFIFYAVMIAVAWHYYRKYHPAPIGKMNGNAFWTVIAVFLIVRVFSVAMVLFSQKFFNQEQSSNQNAINSLLSSNKIVLYSMLLGIIVLSPVLEELVFRGMLIDGLLSNVSTLWAMVISGAAFATAHAFSNPFLFMVYASMGAGMAFIYRKTGTIKANITFHMLNNLLASISFLPLLFK